MSDIRASDIMVQKVHSVAPGLTLVALEHDLANNRISGAPVVEDGRVVGIVSRTDIDRFLSRERSATAATAAFYWAGDLPPDVDAAPADPTTTAFEKLKSVHVHEVMTTDVISVAPGDAIVDVARVMHEKRIHRVLVVDEGQLCGLISSLDIVGVFAGAKG